MEFNSLLTAILIAIAAISVLIFTPILIFYITKKLFSALYDSTKQLFIRLGSPFSGRVQSPEYAESSDRSEVMYHPRFIYFSGWTIVEKVISISVAVGILILFWTKAVFKFSMVAVMIWLPLRILYWLGKSIYSYIQKRKYIKAEGLIAPRELDDEQDNQLRYVLELESMEENVEINVSLLTHGSYRQSGVIIYDRVSVEQIIETNINRIDHAFQLSPPSVFEEYGYRGEVILEVDVRINDEIDIRPSYYQVTYNESFAEEESKRFKNALAFWE